jgi:hypothetical protein
MPGAPREEAQPTDDYTRSFARNVHYADVRAAGKISEGTAEEISKVVPYASGRRREPNLSSRLYDWIIVALLSLPTWITIFTWLGTTHRLPDSLVRWIGLGGGMLLGLFTLLVAPPMTAVGAAIFYAKFIGKRRTRKQLPAILILSYVIPLLTQLLIFAAIIVELGSTKPHTPP